MLSLQDLPFSTPLLAAAALFMLLHMNLSLCHQGIHYFLTGASHAVQLYGPISYQIVCRSVAVVKDLFFLHIMATRLFEFVSSRRRPVE